MVDSGNKYYEEAMQGEWDEDYNDPHMEESEGYGEQWNTEEEDHMTEGGGDYESPSQQMRDEL